MNDAPASRTAATNQIFAVVTGVDNATVGQSTAVDSNVPTGAIVKYIEFQLAMQNLVNVAAFAHVTIQYKLANQNNVSPNVVGGNPQRNQVLHQDLFCIGQNQNVNRTYKFKIPKKFQRVREGMIWQLVWQGDQIHTAAAQAIYKFYR